MSSRVRRDALTTSRAVLAVVVALFVSACSPQVAESDPVEQSPAALQAHSEEFAQGIVEVTDRVWMAIGYGLANSILIEADDGLIIIDTMETLAEGRRVATEFRALSDKPLKALIYTHNHTDHVFGAEAFVQVLGAPDVPVEVFAHESTAAAVYRIVSEYRPIITARSLRMFGSALTDSELVNNGIGPRLAIDEDSAFGFVAPTRTVRDRLAVTVAGEPLELVHAPGETDDQIFVWLPQRQVLAVGDNLYKAFPNLYTIRGTPYRSLKDWARSIDAMRALPVAYLVPSHSRPLQGAAEVQRVLTNYRDAIRYVYDQSVRWINAGLTPNELVERVQLPPHLAQEPYLAEFYGTVRWSARAVFAGNLGWFDGNPTTLDPLPPVERAQRLATLAGGVAALQRQLREAVDADDNAWALELSDALLRLDPDDAAARQLRVNVLRRLGERATNPNARHYYLMSARELGEGLRLRPVNSGTLEMLRAIPMDAIMDALATNLQAEKTLDLQQKVELQFTDTDETWTLWLRRGVLEPVPRALSEPDIVVAVDSLIWKQMLGRQISPVVAIARHMDFRVGSSIGLTRFLLLFDPLREAPEPAPLATVGL
ncbi:MAG: alkyl sulfatase dimerization domain-containing protein [Oceanococcaceae bacterium]